MLVLAAALCDCSDFLATMLNSGVRRTQIWFQNQRANEKKTGPATKTACQKCVRLPSPSCMAKLECGALDNELYNEIYDELVAVRAVFLSSFSFSFAYGRSLDVVFFSLFENVFEQISRVFLFSFSFFFVSVARVSLLRIRRWRFVDRHWISRILRC